MFDLKFLIWAGFVVFGYFLAMFLIKRLQRKAKDTEGTLDDRVLKVLKRLTNVLALLLLASPILEKFGINLGTVIGMAGAGVGFGLQKVWLDIAGIYSLILSKDLDIGAEYESPKKHKGIITEINALSFTIRLENGKRRVLRGREYLELPHDLPKGDDSGEKKGDRDFERP